jgi:hypothetical protein
MEKNKIQLSVIWRTSTKYRRDKLPSGGKSIKVDVNHTTSKASRRTPEL